MCGATTASVQRGLQDFSYGRRLGKTSLVQGGDKICQRESNIFICLKVNIEAERIVERVQLSLPLTLHTSDHIVAGTT